MAITNQADLRRNDDNGNPRCVVWSAGRRFVYKYQSPIHFVINAVLFGVIGAGGVYWLLVAPKPWVEWIDAAIVINADTSMPPHHRIDVTLYYRLLEECDRVRVIAPLSLVEIAGPNGIRSIQLPRQPSSEVTAAAGEASARVQIELGTLLREGVPHEITFGLSCLTDANGGSIKAAKAETLVKSFTP